MSFRLVDEAKNEFPVQRLCNVLGVSQSRGRAAVPVSGNGQIWFCLRMSDPHSRFQTAHMAVLA